MAKILKSNKATTVKSVLVQLHLQQYLPTFQKYDIDFTTFLTLNEQTLKTIGIKNEKHRKKLILWIKRLQYLLISTNKNNIITVNTSTVPSPTINTMKLLSEEDKEAANNLDLVDNNDDDEQIIIDEQVFLAAVQDNNKEFLTPITEEEDDDPSFFLNSTNNNDTSSNTNDDGKDDDDITTGSSTTNASATSIIAHRDDPPLTPPEYSLEENSITGIRRRHNDENHDDANDEIDGFYEFDDNNNDENEGDNNDNNINNNINNNNTNCYCHSLRSTLSLSTLRTSISSSDSQSLSPSSLFRFSSPLRIFGGGDALVESDNSINNNNNNNRNDDEKKRRRRSLFFNPKRWSHPTPIISPSVTPPSIPRSLSLSLLQPPSYGDVFDNYKNGNFSAENSEPKVEEDVTLPEYSCSVSKSGYVLIKKEYVDKGSRARIRSWKRRYLYLWGTLLRLYKFEPSDMNTMMPIHEFSMHNVQIGLAIDYSKRKNVLRIKFNTGYQYLIHTEDKEECVSWIEKLQSSSNISPTIDERQMPMFITLPTRRRNNNNNNYGNSGNSNNDDRNAHAIQSSELLNYYTNNSLLPSSVVTSVPVSTNLTYQQFNEIAREIQQVQITNYMINQQLSW